MSKINENISDRIEKKYKKEIYPSRKTIAKLLVVVITFSVVSSFHGMNEDWAWEVAKALISINGFLIGFSILGITILSSRGYSKAMFRASIEQSVDELFNRLKDSGKKPEEIMKEELTEEILFGALAPFLDVLMIRQVFLGSMEILLTSIGFSMLLFGVKTELMNNPLLEIMFSTFYSLAISSFILGAYWILKGISTVLEKGTRLNITQGIDVFLSIFDKKLKKSRKDLEKNKNKVDL